MSELSMYELTREQAIEARGALNARIRVLHNLIQENENLSRPCPEGHWRWPAVELGGGRKSEEKLAADRARAAAKAVQFRQELVVAEAAYHALASDHRLVGGD